MRLVLQRTKFSGGSSRQSRIPANSNKIIANSPGAYTALIQPHDCNKTTTLAPCMLWNTELIHEAYFEGRCGAKSDRLDQLKNRSSHFPCCASDQVDFFFIESNKTW